jgi:hypothetical protein
MSHVPERYDGPAPRYTRTFQGQIGRRPDLSIRKTQGSRRHLPGT